MISLSIVKYVLTAALRDKLVFSLFLLIILGSSISLFLGSAATTESDQFALVFASGGLRVAGALGLVLFVVFHMRRSFDTKDVDYLLTRPIKRSTFIFSHAAAFSILAAFLAVCVGLALAAIAGIRIGAFTDGFFLWTFSILIEFIIIANVSLFFAMVLPSAAMGALSVLALYMLSRLIGQILGIIDKGITFAGIDALNKMMEIVSLIVPRLDLFGQTSWLIYGTADIGYGFILMQGILYTALIVMAAQIDLVRRQF